jgi:hypothetical protein
MGERVRVRGNLISFPLPLITREPSNAGIMKREIIPAPRNFKEIWRNAACKKFA